MPLSRTRDYLSIGEVLEAIRPAFPDVSISKIRFLENEGLIAPERTESGYRKFYEPDVARLRYILALQRDHFLPLKVIRQRLAELEGNGGPADPATARAATEADEDAAADGAADERPNIQLTLAELIAAAGVSEGQVRGLEDYGLLRHREDDSYDSQDVQIARAAGGLFDFGIEPRHMRMFRQAAEREAALIEQIVAPVARKRDPEARRQAAESARRLVELARRMREGLLRSTLRDVL
ncbi:MAG: MerR family transcriptional regulator [Actinomycetota bacterium]